jgi:hypothetical protein
MVTATPTPTPAPSQPPPATPPAETAAARVAATSRAVPPAANGSVGQDTTESAAARPEPLSVPIAPRSPQRPLDDYGDGGGSGLSPGRVAALVGGAVAMILVAVVLVLTLNGDDENPPPENSFGNTPSVQDPASSAGSGTGSPSGTAAPSDALTRAERRATDVAVLNGTTQTGLARAVANKIQEDGFTIGGVATNADQSVPTTIVSYTGDNEKAALAVAKIIGIDRGSVQAADANTAAAATGDVIVTVGSDQIE